MSNNGISPLRQMMVEVMTLKGLSPVMQDHYPRSIAVFNRHTRHRLEIHAEGAILVCVLKQIAGSLKPPTTNATVTVMRLF